MKKLTFVGIFVILQGIAPAVGQASLGEKLRKEYENCVYAAVGKTWQEFPKIDPSLAAEGAFQACLTEEQGIRAMLLSLQTPYPQTETAVAGLKLRIKRTVREIMTDPAGYQRRHGG